MDLEQGIRQGVFPGAVGMLADVERIVWQSAVGHRMVTPQMRTMQLDTVFDMASLTKVVATATLAMQCVERGRFSLDTDIRSILPAFRRSGICIHHLLTHTSGLPRSKALYVEPGDPTRVVLHLGEMELAYPTGTQVVYSCLGYILLGKVIQAACGSPLDKLAREWIFDPLGMRNTRFDPPPEWRYRCAAGEYATDCERRQVDQEYYDWRDSIIVGVVHDENTLFLGRVAGNSGLFSTAGDLVRFGQALLSGGQEILTPESVAQLGELQTCGLGGRRSFGWTLTGDGSLYQCGFTGTALRIDLKRQRVAVLLTNRLHPEASREGIGNFRASYFAWSIAFQPEEQI